MKNFENLFEEYQAKVNKTHLDELEMAATKSRLAIHEDERLESLQNLIGYSTKIERKSYKLDEIERIVFGDDLPSDEVLLEIVRGIITGEVKVGGSEK
jgi:hypothetical protein